VRAAGQDPTPTRETLSRFAVEGEPSGFEPLRVGLIHDSYVATCRVRAGVRRYLLQRLNTGVFPSAGQVMENLSRVTAHLRRKLLEAGRADVDRRVLAPVPARDGRYWHVDGNGHWWRTYAFIEGSCSRDRPESPEEVHRAAEAFGSFVAGLADLPEPRLHETLPGFHDTPARHRALLAAIEADPHGRAAQVRAEVRLVDDRRTELGVLQEAADRGELPERVVHNDTKLNNVLFDSATGEALCVVDLDTVMPGLALHDYGDLVRSAASEAREDVGDPSRARLSLPLFREVTRGWLGPMAGLLTSAEVELMPLAPRVIALELAIRFLTDYLEGDRYFRVERPGHNLDRCRAQLALAADLERQETAMAAVVRESLGG
jgi:hypothetical protein